MQEHRFDVLVVGAGAAGLRAALAAAGEGAAASGRVALISKVHPLRVPTVAAAGGIAAALANVDADTWQDHAFDTIRCADFLADQDAVELMCREAPEAVFELEHLGIPFNRTRDGRIDQRMLPGHTHSADASPARRTAYAGDRVGQSLVQLLYQHCLAADVACYPEFVVLDLLFDTPDGSGPVGGVLAYELATGELHRFRAAAVVLAAGGCGQLFQTTSNAQPVTGDALAIALRRGLPLQDMEFFQFHPTGVPKLGILVSASALGAGGVLRNAAGDAFLSRYAPRTRELAPFDIVARAVVTEIAEGRGCGPARDHVLLDLTGLRRKQVDKLLPEVATIARTFLDVEPQERPIPVRPTAHYAMGGLPTTTDGEVLRTDGSLVPGLYAAGETACVSVHGASRLAANGLLEAIVFGRRAGAAAASFAAEVTSPIEEPDHSSASLLVDRLRSAGGTERAARLRAELQRTMDDAVSVVRTGRGLAAAAATVSALKDRYAQVGITDPGLRFNTEFVQAVELGFLLDLAEVVIACAASRTESRGAHVRADHPERNDADFGGHSLAFRAATAAPDATRPELRLTTKPVTITDFPPDERAY